MTKAGKPMKAYVLIETAAGKTKTVKKELGIEVYQPDREKQVLHHVRTVGAEGPLGGDAIARLFERIIDEARRLERRVVHGEQEEAKR